MIVDLALSVTGSQLIASVLPTVRSFLKIYGYLPDTCRRPTRINVPFCTSALEDIL